MDYVDWCCAVLTVVERESEVSPTTQLLGVEIHGLEHKVFDDADIIEHADNIVLDALFDLRDMGLLVQDSIFVKPTQVGRRYLADPVPFWESWCDILLKPDWEAILRATNRLGAVVHDGYSDINRVSHDVLLHALGWTDSDKLHAVCHQIETMGLVSMSQTLGPSFWVAPNLKGMVWEKRRGFTIEARWMDEKIREWETTSVDFKRDVHTDTKDQIAEFVKDVLGLVNTQSSGQRWMIIGFDNKTRAYFGPPNTKLTADHFEQLMAVYTEPVVELRYQTVDYRGGVVGKLEVLRQAVKLPYRVAKSVGFEKRIEKGEIFVRHGSQTEPPTPAELKVIEDEGKMARGMHASGE